MTESREEVPDVLLLNGAVDEQFGAENENGRRKKEGSTCTSAAFFSLGLINNASYVIMMALAKDIMPGAVGWVFLANVVPTMLIKASAPFWFHLVPYGVRITVASLTMVACFSTVAFGRETWVQLIGVGCSALQGGIGEASFLALASFYDTPMALSAWSSGTGFAGIFGYAWVFFLKDALGFSNRATLMMACSLAVAWMMTYFVLLGEPHDPSVHTSDEYINSSSLGESVDRSSTVDGVHHGVIDSSSCVGCNSNGTQAQSSLGGFGRAYTAMSFRQLSPVFRQANGVENGRGAENGGGRSKRLRGTSGKGIGEGVGEQNGEGQSSAFQETLPSFGHNGGRGGWQGVSTFDWDENDINSNEITNASVRPAPTLSSLILYDVEAKQAAKKMTARERLRFTASLWRFMIPLTLVFFAEYTMQTGTWSSIGFPITSADARRRFYLYSNWSYQGGVFVSRSTGMILKISAPALWILPMVQVIMLFFFFVVAAERIWYNNSLLFLCFGVGLIGGLCYVNAFRLVAEAVPSELRELALTSASVGDSVGVICSDIVGTFVQKFLYRVNGISD